MFFDLTVDFLPKIAISWDRLGLIAAFFIVAWLIHRLARRLSRPVMRLSRFAGGSRAPSESRQETLQGLIAGAITFVVFAAAGLSSFSLFVDASTLVWMVGLFSAAFGLGARPLVSDFLAGASFIFDDIYDVGEKVQLLGLAAGDVEGVVEKVNLRTTLIRAGSGEPFTVPNGEIRVVRNFSRGRFSASNVTLKLGTSDLPAALALLDELGNEAMHLLPNLLEPWQVISETGLMGQQTELTVLAKAKYGKAAEMRPRLLSLIQERLSEAGIPLAS